jgi:N-acyl-D-amino-acid deacylase
MRFVTALLVLLATGGVLAAAPATRPASKPAATRPAFDPDHEIVIRHGRVMDGAGNAWINADVLIRGGRIATIGPKVNASPSADEIDARNLIVAPGFIDVHTHADNGAVGSLAENFVRDGVTTIVCGNCGGSPRDIGAYFDRLRSKGCAVNVACLIGHNTILQATKGSVARKLTPAEMVRAREMVRQAMRDGAVGMSTGLIYRPGIYSDTEEIIELQREAAKLGGIYATHMRSEGSDILAAIDEALRVGRECDCRVEISHFKLPADVARAIGGAATTLGRVQDARANGVEVWLDQYPYTASSTSLSVLLPDWVYDHGPAEAKKRLNDPEQVRKILADMRANYEVKRRRTSLGYAVIASCAAEPNLAGRNLYEIAQLFKWRQQNRGKQVELLAAPEALTKLPEPTMEDQYRAVIDLCLRGGASCVFHSMDEREVEDILRCPLVSIASDSAIRDFGIGQPHPRGYGTNARVLGHYVRERQTIPLEDAVRKMTSLPATAFRFTDRGLLRPGYVADVTIFDPDAIVDTATFEKPHQYAQGVVDVIVNGYAVLRDGQMTGLLPGAPILGPGAQKAATAPAAPSTATPAPAAR